MMMRRAAILILLAALGLGPAMAADALPRVVSLDVCADQYVLQFADRDQILAVSQDAARDFSYLRDRALGIPIVRDMSEDVLALRPDAIVRLWGGSERSRLLYARLGIEEIQLGFAETLGDVEASVRQIAAALGHADRGEDVIAAMAAKLASVPPTAPRRAMYLTASGVTSGAGTLMDEMLTLAGLRNSIAEAGYRGWRTVPLEEILRDPPDVFVLGYFDVHTNTHDSWTAAAHPVLEAQIARGDRVEVSGAAITCAAWYLADAVVEIRAALAPPVVGAEARAAR